MGAHAHNSVFSHCLRWPRFALAALLLALTLNSIAHVSHRHEAASNSAPHSIACGYCVAFGGLADAPARTCLSVSYLRPEYLAQVAVSTVPSQVLRRTAQPRAPPRLA